VENNPYPADFRVRREAHALRDAGHTVTVMAPRATGQPWTEEVDGVAVFRFPSPWGGTGAIGYAFEFGYATIAMLVLAVWVAMRKGIDVIHAGNPPDTLFVVGGFFKLFGKRFIFDQHDLSPETYLSRFAQPRENILYRILGFLERCSYALADVVIVTNESYRQLAIQRGGKDPSAVIVVRNGPPLSYGPVEPEQHVTKHAEHLIGYVGTIGPQDGVDFLLRAVHKMVFTLRRRDFLAIIIGDGDAYDEVRLLAKELGVESYVLFTGRLSEANTRKYLSGVDVCVQPDPLSPLNDQSTMNKLMEYMALGKPTVAFDLVETRVSAADAALYVRPNDELELAKCITWLFDHPSERERLGQIGRRRVAESLAWEYSVPKLLSAYGMLRLKVTSEGIR
jgi:glycosyltransferase involved in cell wall biosynthesis